MKKNLLIMGAMLGMVVAGNAQSVGRYDVKADNSISEKSNVVSVGSVKHLNNVKTRTLAPRKDASTGVYYKRPVGTFYLGSMNNYAYLVVPPFTDLPFLNMCGNKESATWTVGGEAVDAESIDADNNYVGNYRVTSGVYYVPTINSGRYSYYYGETMPEAEAGYLNQGILTPDSMMNMTHVDLSLGGNYSGFADGRVFGTFSFTYQGQTLYCDRVIEYYDAAPARPFCLSSIYFNYISDSETAIAAGKEQKLTLYKLNEQGQMTQDIITQMTITSKNIMTSQESGGSVYGYIEVSNTEIDAMGTEIPVPVIIDQPFALVIDGFAQEGVDYQLRMTSVGDTEDVYNEETGEGVYPTMLDMYDASGNRVGSMSEAWTDEETGENLQYNMIVWFDGMFDVVEKDEVFNNMVAPVEGGEIYAEDEEGMYRLELETTLPWISEWKETEGEENYYFENLPDWLTPGEVNTEYWSQYKVVQVPITAEALPEGVEGREAEVSVVSDRGALCTFVVTQSAQSGPATAIQNVKSESMTSDYFNVTGQRVNANHKGIVINNGKKQINK